MAIHRGPKILTNGLILALDPKSPRSYSGSGVKWGDLSRGGNDASLVNGPVYNSGGYFTLDGSNDKVSIINAGGDFNLGLGDFTITLWINPKYDTTYPHMVTFDDQSMFTLKAIRGGAVDPFQIYIYQGTSIMFTNSYLTNDVWQMITLTREDSTHKLYINGILSDTVSATPKNITCSNVYFGHGWSSEYTPQDRGPIYIYNVLHNPQQILEHFNSQVTRFI